MGRAGARSVGPPALVAIAIAYAVLDHGGFTTTARVVFATLAALAAAASLFAGGRPAVRAVWHPFVAVLLGLAVLGALSALWTIGPQEHALAWAVLPAGYALLAIATIAAPDASAMRMAVLVALCLCAFVSGVVGLLGAATFAEPQAFRPIGAWRPAGTLEYTPALALLQVCALAPLLRALCAGGWVAWIAAPPALVAGAVLGLSGSRLGVALAALVLVAVLLAPHFTVRASARQVVAAVSLVAFAGVAARAVLGGEVPAGAPSEGWRVAVVVAACVCAPLAWAAIRSMAGKWPAIVLACVVAGVVASGAVGGFAGGLAPSASGPPAPAAVVVDGAPAPRVKSDALHGRGDIWRSGLEAFRQRPLQGHGAASFLPATLDLQQRRLTAYGHNLPLELGVELGLAGVLLALVLYLVALRACWRTRASRDAWLLAVPCLAFLVANLVDWPWHIAGLGAVWAAATGALIAGSFAGACTSADGPLGRRRAPLRMQPTEVGQ